MFNKLILFSVLSVPLTMAVWSFGLLHLDTANLYTGLLTFLYSFYLPNLFPKSEKYKKIQYALLLLTPFLYLVVGIYAQSWNLFAMSIFYAVLVYIVALFLPKINSIKYHIAVLGLALLYMFGIYPQTDMWKERLALQNMVKPELNSNVKVTDFSFIDFNQDTIQLANNKPILIETWNQTCKPCMASIRDLQTIFEQDSSFSYIYLYQNRANKDTLSTEKIFAFKAIKNKENILIDIQNQLFKKMNLSGYPFFLVFDKKGKLVGYQEGYNPEKKDEIVQKLRDLLAKAN